MDGFLKWLFGTHSGEFAVGEDWQLTLLSDYGSNVTMAMLAVTAALVWLTVRSYRREGQTPAWVKALLAGMRLAVVALAFVILFQPAIALRSRKVLHSSVVVLVDDSLSMSFADRYADDAQYRARLAEYLGVQEADLAGMTRLEVIRKALSRPDGPVAKLAQDHPLVFMRYSTANPGRDPYTRQLGEVNLLLAQADQPAGEPPPLEDRMAGVLGLLTAGGFETNIPRGLRDAIESIQGRRVAALVIISDGQSTASGGEDRLSAARDYASAMNVPVYAVVVGDPTAPKNIAVTALRGPREARRGSRVEFTADVAHHNVADETVIVRLQRRAFDNPDEEWADTGASAEVALAASGEGDGSSVGLTSVVLTVESDQIGEFVYRAVVEPRPYELNVADNSAETPLTVDDEKINVLLISGDSGWEFQYLRNVLLRAPDRYRLSVWQQNANKDVSQLASSDQMKLSRLPRELDELMGVKGDPAKPGYDVVILYDPQPVADSFDQHFVENLLKPFVGRGRGVCYIAGNKYSEAVLSDKAGYQALADILPVALAPNPINYVERIGQRVPDPWPVVLTDYGKDHPVMRLAGSVDDSAGLWRSLPGIYWSHPVRRCKPAAHVLAENSNPARRTVRNEPEPLIATQIYDKGRVLYVGCDDTWRWRLLRDGYYHRRFWGNVVHYLATSRARQVMIRCGGDRFDAGKDITVEAEAYDEKQQPLRDATFDVEIVNLQTGRSTTITLAAVEGRPGHYKATIKAAQVGSFELTALAGDPQAGQKVAGKRISVELPQAESVRRQADETMMRSIATRAEGFLRPYELDRLTQMIPAGRQHQVNEQHRQLWDRPVSLVLIVLLLAGEWIVRKKYNMA